MAAYHNSNNTATVCTFLYFITL